jgi:hypothetical protein
MSTSVEILIMERHGKTCHTIDFTAIRIIVSNPLKHAIEKFIVSLSMQATKIMHSSIHYGVTPLMKKREP